MRNLDRVCYLLDAAAQLRTTVIGIGSAFWTGAKRRWPSGVTANQRLLITPGTSNSFRGVPAWKEAPAAMSTTMMV